MIFIYHKFFKNTTVSKATLRWCIEFVEDFNFS